MDEHGCHKLFLPGPDGRQSITEHQVLGTAEVNDAWGDEKGKKMTQLTLSFPFIVKKTPHSLQM